MCVLSHAKGIIKMMGLTFAPQCLSIGTLGRTKRDGWRRQPVSLEHTEGAVSADAICQGVIAEDGREDLRQPIMALTVPFLSWYPKIQVVRRYLAGFFILSD